MAPTLYYMQESAPCRAVLLTANVLNIKLNLKVTQLLKGEHKTPEYLKLNPQHTIPTLVEDDGFRLSESRAIIAYLVNKYAKESTLNPEEPKSRALVDQRLYFDIGTLYQRYLDYLIPRFYLSQPADPAKKDKIYDALKILEEYLEGQTYVAGPHLTIADLSLVASVSCLDIIDVDFHKYENIKRWYSHLKETIPGYKETNEDGVSSYKAILQNLEDNPQFLSDLMETLNK